MQCWPHILALISLVLDTEQEYIIWTSHAKREDKVQRRPTFIWCNNTDPCIQHFFFFPFAVVCKIHPDSWFLTLLPLSSNVWSTEVIKPNHMLLCSHVLDVFSLIRECVELWLKSINSLQPLQLTFISLHGICRYQLHLTFHQNLT